MELVLELSFQQSSVIVPFSVNDTIPGIFYKFTKAAFEKFRLVFLYLNGINSYTLIELSLIHI